MRVLLAHASAAGPLYYRMTEPARAILESGADVEVTVSRGLVTTVQKDEDGQQVVVDVDPRGHDVVVVQLPKTVQMLQTIRLLQAKGVAVVVEMDDLLSGVPFGHSGHAALVRRGMAKWGLECCREADFVTVSTPALLEEYAQHGRGAVVANAVHRRFAELPPAYERDPEIVTIGWSGNVLNHPYDLQEMGSGLQQALDRTTGRSRFLIIGQKWDVRERLRLPSEPDEVPWMTDPDDYITALGHLFDVGIAPLRMDRFNECKSWLKPLEYAARGIFSVRARTREYERLGLGMPARAPKDWAKFVTGAVQDADRRREVAAANHEKVLAGHLTEHRVEQWLAAWRSALEHRARTRPAAVAVGG
jgi:Glycosyl transferases group 1